MASEALPMAAVNVFYRTEAKPSNLRFSKSSAHELELWNLLSGTSLLRGYSFATDLSRGGPAAYVPQSYPKMSSTSMSPDRGEPTKNSIEPLRMMLTLHLQ
jgi:hypothetical protein